MAHSSGSEHSRLTHPAVPTIRLRGAANQNKAGLKGWLQLGWKKSKE